MITPQRLTGAWLSFFTACVVVNHFLQCQISFFDLVYVGFFIPLFVSAFIDSKILKTFQVGIILTTGVVIVSLDQPSQPFGLIIMAFAPLYAFTYGLLDRHMVTKGMALAALYLILFSVSLDNAASATMWLMMCFTIHAGIWVNVRHLVEKARIADEIIRKDLEQSLAKKEALLEETVKAGMVLVKEIKSKDAEHECEE